MEYQEDPIEIKIPVLRLRQPIGDFFIGAIRARDLYKICQFDIRRIENEGGLDTYLGIQRELKDDRVKEIAQYVTTRDATFPTAVILAVDQRCAIVTDPDGNTIDGTATQSRDLPAGSETFENSDDDTATAEVPAALDQARFQILTLRNIPNPTDGLGQVLLRKIARVLDGQHRIAGLESYQGADFEVNVAIFVGLDISMQAGIFSVVNLAQTKVNRSLVYDLYSYDRARFPEKTCHEIAVALDKSERSPFSGMIKRLGVSSAGRFGQTLSQATFVEGLLPYLSEDIILDRDIGRRGLNWPSVSSEKASRMIFRQMFIEEKDLEIAQIVRNFFDAVKLRWPEAWAWTGSGRILNKTTGFSALIRFLRPAYLHFSSPGGVVTRDQFLSLLQGVRLESNQFDTDTFKPGSSGTSKFYHQLMIDCGFEARPEALPQQQTLI